MTESSYALKIGERIPRHVAIIMDGNGRWAKARGKIRIFGHHAGVGAVRSSVQRAAELGVKVLTLFAFSSENWNRPEAEVSGLMKLFGIAIRKELPSLMKNGIRVRFIGDLSRFDRSLRQMLERAMEETRDNGALLLNIAVNYGGRWDIVNAARLFAQTAQRGALTPHRSARRRSPATSRPVSTRTLISSSGPAATSASAISSSGSLPTLRSS